MIVAALIVAGVFDLLGLIPSGPRPTRGDIFGAVHVDYKLALNILGTVIFAALFWLTMRRGETDPVCGMKVDRAKAITRPAGGTGTGAGKTAFFCSAHCADEFDRANRAAGREHPQPAAR
jgi:uncharacterized protein